MWEIVTLVPHSRAIATNASCGVIRRQRSGSAPSAEVVTGTPPALVDTLKKAGLASA